MGITRKEFEELSDRNGVGIHLIFRIGGIEYGFAGISDKFSIGGNLIKTVNSLLATMTGKGIISVPQWKEISQSIIEEIAVCPPQIFAIREGEDIEK